MYGMQIVDSVGPLTFLAKVVDGHFDNTTWWPNSCRDPFFIHQNYLEAVGGKDKSCLETFYDGRIWRDFVFEALPEKVRKKGAKSSQFLKVFNTIPRTMIL